MSEDRLKTTLERVYENQEIPLVFTVAAEPVISSIFQDDDYMADKRHGFGHSFPEFEEYQLSAAKHWGGGLPPGVTHRIKLQEPGIDATRKIEIYVRPDGEIFSYGDEREVKLELPNGDKVEIRSSNYAHRAEAKAESLPEPRGETVVLMPEEIAEASKNFRQVLIFKKGGELVSLVETEKGIIDEAAKEAATKDQKVLFEMSCQKFLGGVDLSLQNLLS